MKEPPVCGQTQKDYKKDVSIAAVASQHKAVMGTNTGSSRSRTRSRIKGAASTGANHKGSYSIIKQRQGGTQYGSALS
jgi:hypothetical protein